MDEERRVASPPQSPTSIFLKSYLRGYGKKRGRHEDEATTIVHQALDDLLRQASSEWETVDGKDYNIDMNTERVPRNR